MQVTAAVIGAALILLVLWESFETLVLPRRVTRRLRMTRLYYRASWGFWRRIGRQHPGQRRENYLSVFAPLSLLLLLAIWVGGVVLGFALIQFGLDTPLRPGGDAAFATHLYLSATTFVTLGLGRRDERVVGRAGDHGHRGGGGVRVPGADDLVPAGAVPGVLPARGADLDARSMGGFAARARSSSCVVRPRTVRSDRSTSCSPPGSAGRRSCSRAISPIPCWPTSVPSTNNSPGWPR